VTAIAGRPALCEDLEGAVPMTTRLTRTVEGLALLALLGTWRAAWSASSCPPGDFGGCSAQCEAGDGGSCEQLAAIYRVGTVGVARDEQRAVELYRKACALGSTDGCTWLRRMYREGRGFDEKGPPKRPK
jgi:TPR repeat protein